MIDRKIATAISVTSLGIVLSGTAVFANAKTGTVTASALNIRSGPSTSNSVVGYAYKGDKLQILETSNGWYKVKLSNGKTGWGSGKYINVSGDSSSETPSSGKTGTITADALNVRSGPSTSYGKVTMVYKGQSVTILESSNGWHKIKTQNGQIGWASSDYISTSGQGGGGSEETPSTGKGTVTASTLNIRSGPSTSNSIVGKAYKGNTVDILSSSNGWYKVKLSNGQVGWGSSDYISKGGEGSGGSEGSGGGSSETNNAQAIINTAKAQLGKPYVWGAEGPNSFDCSGLVYYVYGQHGIKMPRTSREQANVGTTVSQSQLQPGDLIFSSTDGSGGVNHVGIYIGNGQMIHAPQAGDVVKTTNINSSYWQYTYVKSKRVL